MQFILDHFNSLLVAGAVILILMSVQIGARRTSLEQTTSYSTKVKATTFGEWIEDDILTIGENFGRNRFRFLAPDTTADGNTGAFTFFSDSLITSTDTLRMMTRYALEHVETVIRGDSIPRRLYQLHRYTAQVPVVNGSAPIPPITSVTTSGPSANAWYADGRSLSTLSGFRVDLLEGDGRLTTDIARCDFLRIQFRLVPEFPIEPEYLRELYWTTTLKIRPFWEPPT